jgi:hypothetical protein
MTRLTAATTEAATGFIWLTGRVLDQRRMANLNGGGDRDGVLAALEAYRTGDGGYAFGLEPDIKGPEPQPLTVMTALRILDEVGVAPGAPEIAWLGRHRADDGGFPALLESIAGYPRPPWIEPPTGIAGGLLPTGRIAGLMHKHRASAPWLDAATGFCWTAIEELEATHPYEVESALVFLDNAPDRPRALKAAARLGEMVRQQGLVMLDPAHPERFSPAPGYAEGEFHYAYDFAPTPQSLGAQWFSADETATALDHLARSQQGDGGWQISWRRWAPTTESEARPGVTIEKLHILRAWDSASLGDRQ